MGWLSKKHNDTIGLFGKHPTASDFLKADASSVGLKIIDGWLSENIVCAQSKIDWKKHYSSAPTTSFIYSSKDTQKIVTGTLAPSSDRSGRDYPLVLFAEIDFKRVKDLYHTLPHHSFYSRANALLAQRLDLSREQVLGLPSRLTLFDDASIEQSNQESARYLEQTRCGPAFGAMYGARMGLKIAGRSIEDLRSLTKHSLKKRPLRYGLRVPLSQPSAGQLIGRISPDGNVGFWLSIIRNFAPTLMPSVVWTKYAATLFLGPPNDLALASTWLPGIDDNAVWNLGSDQTREPLKIDPKSSLQLILNHT